METVEDAACVLAEHDVVLKAQARLTLLALNVRSGSKSKGSMVTTSTPAPDGAGTKMTVEIRWYATNDSPSMSSSSVTTR